MSIRHTKNATTRTVKRHVVTQLIEVSPPDGTTIFTGENNPNMVNFDSGTGNAFFYPGYDHIPVGVLQVGSNP